ncbi:MAG: AzlC family ABC transporter permease [Candidatus Heimdallarchaeota archaeon]|nr:AzlC family ABC transporter permease [Candidatus Heimdallarchaeota archaeon]
MNNVIKDQIELNTFLNIKYHFPSIKLGITKMAPILPSVMLFGLIFGLTGVLSGLPWYLISAMSYIIFAGSAQFIVLLLIIKGETYVAMVIAGIMLNLRHFLFGAALHEDIKSKGIKRLILAYLLTDEAYLITTLVKQEIKTNNEESKWQIEDVWLGGGFTLWLFWNLTTILGYFLSSQFQILLSIPADIVVAGTFLGYLIMYWKNNPHEKYLLLIMIVLSIILGFLFQGSSLLIIILLSGMILAVIIRYINKDETITEELNNE